MSALEISLTELLKNGRHLLAGGDGGFGFGLGTAAAPGAAGAAGFVAGLVAGFVAAPAVAPAPGAAAGRGFGFAVGATNVGAGKGAPASIPLKETGPAAVVPPNDFCFGFDLPLIRTQTIAPNPATRHAPKMIHVIVSIFGGSAGLSGFTSVPSLVSVLGASTSGFFSTTGGATATSTARGKSLAV